MISTDIKFGEFATFKYGKMPIKTKIKEVGQYPIFSGYRNVGYYDEFNVQKGQLIIVARGVGGTGDVKLTEEPCFLTNLSIAADIDCRIASPKFLYYYFSQKGLRYLDSGSAQSQITISDLEKVIIQLPPLEDQLRIESCLGVLDDKIRENETINHNLQQQAQAIFQSWFVDFSHWGNTPPDWEQGVFSDYVTVKRGGSPRPIQDYLSATGYRWLKISDVTSLQTPYITTIAEHIKESGIGKTVFLKSGSLVLSNSATPGIPKILDVDSCIHDGWLYFPQSEFSNEFLLLFFLQIRPKLVALGNGSVFTNLKTDILKSYPISKPPKEVLEEFDNIVKPLFSTILLNTRQNNHLICVRDSLLPKLMSGEIDVSEVEL